MAGRSDEIANLQVGLELNDQNFTKALGNVSRQSKGMVKDFDVASRSIDNAENKMEAYANAIDKGNRAIETNSQKLQMQTQRYDNLYAKTNRQKQQYDELKEKLKEQERALSSLANTEGKSSNAYKEQEKAINDLKKALQDKLELVQKNSNKLQGYSTDINSTTNDLDRLRNSVRDVEQSMQQANDSMNMDGAEEGAGNLSLFAKASEFIGEKLGGLVGLAAGAGAALAGLLGKSAYEGAVSYDKAITDLRINLGLTKNEAAQFYSEIGKAADGGYTFEGVTSSMELLSQRFNLSNERAAELAKSMDLLNTLGIDNESVTRFMTTAVNDLGMTHEQALDMIMSGQQNGLNMSGDWLDTLMEYSPIFARMGVDGATSMALIDTAISNSSLNTDQAADAVKEFFLRFTEAPKGTADAFSELGLNIQDMQSKVDSGAMTSAEAFQLVNDKLSNVSSEVDRARLTSEIYGGTSEYVSEGVINAWGDTTLAINDTTGAMSNAKDAYEGSYAAMQQDLSNEWSNLKETIGVGVIPILKAVVTDVSGIIEAFGRIPANVGAFASGMSSAFELGMAKMDNAFLSFKVSFLNGSASLSTSMAGFAKTLGLDGMSKSFSEQASKLKKDSSDAAKEIEKNNGIIEKSGSKVKDFFGKLGSDGVKVKTGIDTSQTDKGLDKVKKSADEVNKKEAKVKATADTSGASKNITGLKKNVDDYNKKAGSVKTTKFKTDTASASKNVTGLKSNVNDYDKKNTGKTKKTTFKAETAGASKNVTGLKNNISNFVSRFVKTFTTTFKVVTKYSTSGTPTKQSSGAKATGAGAVSKNTVTPTANNVSTLISPMSPSPSVAPMSTGTVASSPTSTSSPAPMSTSATTDKPPIAIWGGDISNSMKYDVNLLKELENRIQMVSNSLSILDKKMENAVGEEKIGYLQQQNELLKEQVAIQKDLEDKLTRQKNYYQYFLKNKGFQFMADGNLKNEEEKLLLMEKESERLEQIAEAKSKAVSDYKGEDEKHKSSLESQAEASKKASDSYNESLAETKKYLEEYTQVAFTDLPKVKEEFVNIQNSIEDNNQAIEDSKKAIQDFKNEVRDLKKEAMFTSMEKQVKQYNNELSKIGSLKENAFGEDKAKLIQQEIDLYENQIAQFQKMQNYSKNAMNDDKAQLQALGFTFRENGDIVNYDSQIVKLKESNGEYERASELVSDYLDLLINKIPGYENSIIDANNNIKDSYREKLNVTKDIEDKITSVYKEEVDERKKLIDEELDKKLKFFDKEKEAYSKSRAEIDYKDNYQEQVDAIDKLQKKIDMAAQDSSLNGQSKVKELVSQMKEEQKKLEQMVQSNIDEQVLGMYDAEKGRLSDNAEKSIQDLENKWSDSNIADYVKKALGDGVFTDIDGNVRNLKDTMMEFLDESGSAFGVLGNVIKNDLNSNLQQALDTFKNLDSVYGGLNIKVPNVDYSSQRYNPSANNNTTNNTTNNQTVTVQFNQPLVNVQGNVTEDIMPQLEGMIKKAKDELARDIVKKIK